MRKENKSINRRQALGTMGKAIIAGTTFSLGCTKAARGGTPEAKPMQKPARESAGMPAVFLPHGGGPWPFMDERVFGAPGMWAQMEVYMRGLNMLPPVRPKAILVVSAHWEENVATVTTSKNPPMLYDYSGFPPETYKVQWPAPGHPEIAQQIRDLLEGAGIRSAADGARGFDHGTFVPLKLAYPEAEIPTLQLSLKRGLNPREHLAMGRAIAPLREAGVFIVGSGMSYHNMRGLMGSMRGESTTISEDSKRFDGWLEESMQLDPAKRESRLVEWEKAPAARACHPREEHLIPLMVVAGAAGDAVGNLPYRDVVMNAHISAVHFG